MPIFTESLNVSFSKIKEYTKENKELEFLFEGFNRHLRNSIAHFSFSWDNEEQQMDFRDYYYYEKIDTFEPQNKQSASLKTKR